MTDQQLEAMVREYLDTRLENHQTEVNYFRNMPTLRKAIEAAMSGKDHRGKMYSHQCRVGFAVLAEAAPLVIGATRRIARSESFEEIHSIVRDVTNSVPRFGVLVNYDISLRIGAFRGKLPDKVYLHCGTRKGAEIVCPGIRGDVISMKALPPVIGRYMTADEA